MIIAFTGHRPQGLSPEAIDLAHAQVDEAITKHKPELVISGMALCVDTFAAEYARAFQIPYDAYVPFKGQEKFWNYTERANYLALLDSAREVKVVCEGDYAPWKFQKRNEAMVDDCDLLVAIWNGNPGGTANCVKYAKKVGRTIDRYNPGK